MNRRSFLKAAGAAGALTPIPASSIMDHAPRQVIVILGESVRRDMLNCYRQTGLRTPNLDTLAAEGMRFERAYNAQPVCGPARTSIWTGLYPHTSGMWGNSMGLGNIEHTVGQRLHDRGVHTALVGKWHLDGVDYFDTGIPQAGWDPKYWYDMRDYLSELTPEERELSRKPSTIDTIGWPAEKCYGYRVTNRAIDFLQKNGAGDFLLGVCFDEPHGPSLAPRHYSDAYENFIFPSDPNVCDTLKDKPVAQRIWAGEPFRYRQPVARNTQPTATSRRTNSLALRTSTPILPYSRTSVSIERSASSFVRKLSTFSTMSTSTSLVPCLAISRRLGSIRSLEPDRLAPYSLPQKYSFSWM